MSSFSHSTPTRERHSSSQSSSSPMSIRPQTSSSTSSIPSAASLVSSTPTNPTTQPIALDALLAQHADASNPTLAALEQALSERNVFSSQNTQLWKLIEKQRTGYNQVHRDLERLRVERDAYKSRLQAAGLSTELGKKEKGKALRPSASNATMSTVDSRVVGLVRHQSDNSASSIRDHRPTTPTKMSEQLDAPDDHMPPFRTTSQTPASPVVIPPRSASLPQGSPTPTSSQSFSSGVSSPEAQPRTSEGSVTSQPGSQLQSSRSGALHLDANTSSSSLPASPPTSKAHPASLIPHNPSAGTLTPIIEDPRLSQESSRILSATGDSPPPSPNCTGSSIIGSSVSEHGQSRTDNTVINGHQQARRSPNKLGRTDKDDDNEFLDMSGDAENQGDGAAYDQQNHRDPGPLSPSKKKSKARAMVEDFPMPPSYGAVHLPTHHTNVTPQSPGSTDMVTPTQANPQSSSHRHGLQVHPEQKKSQALSPSQSSLVEPGPSPTTPDSPLQSSYLSPVKSVHGGTSTGPSPTFRALPLVYDDLKTTRVTVLHSSVKPNDRGKDVLSFVLDVDPRNGKDSWKVEKMYSDFLGLDQRMRAVVGKSVAKKMGILPEGKVWKDHAPAKADQRKVALEVYLQSLVSLPVRNKDEFIAFLTSDIVRETKKPVMQAGYKEGYLTKRGKNFGGWKTRFFVLQGPVLEYFESRGGTHLGSILITNAQIGRQQRTADNDDEKNYRHAFLIIEAKKGSGGPNPRHVLCAESDAERDSWVDILVRYVSGTFSEDPVSSTSSGPSPLAVNVSQSQGAGSAQPRSSTSSSQDTTATPGNKRAVRTVSKDDISKGAAMPISQLALDASNAKFFQTAPIPESTSVDDPQAYTTSPTKSSHHHAVDRDNDVSTDGHSRRLPEHSNGATEPPLSTSLPTTSPLDSAGQGLVSFRANSELGHYIDTDRSVIGQGQDHGVITDPGKPYEGRRDRKSYYPALSSMSLSPVAPTFPDRAPSPDLASTPMKHGELNGKVKISGPLNGAPIPLGYKFGSKDGEGPSSSDRREKAKSRSFWGFGSKPADKVVSVPRAVFAVPLEESLDVAEIARLPAVVFRCIQYLEAKKAEKEEGIYRLSGSSAVIKGLRDRFNAEGDVDLLGSDEYWDPHAIAGLLKSFMRELPASILTRELHMKFLAVMDFVEPQERIRELSFLIASLPIANYSLLRALTAHLILIVQNSAFNKMTMRNVGIVFSPTLGIPAGVFSLMLGEFNRVFNVDEASDVSEEKAGDMSRRNSRQYSDAAADQLLGLSGRCLNNGTSMLLVGYIVYWLIVHRFCFLATTEETPSEDGDSISLQYESGNETAENGATVESANPTQFVSQYNAYFSSPARSELSSERRRHASNVAASRGLNIAVNNERVDRQSRMVGLPVSPRPTTESPRSPVVQTTTK
ncbi:hypothetical protein EDD17DRAFT_657630 [Pisolithus thermaeus]|nr:hypothetical protein EDD17DRAFT_657630 [Pisolithus thermaeus]